MEAIAVCFGFNPEGVTRNFGFGTRASHSELHEYIRDILLDCTGGDRA